MLLSLLGVQSGIAALTWAAGGYSLLLAEALPEAAAAPLRASGVQLPQALPVAAAQAAQAAIQVCNCQDHKTPRRVDASVITACAFSRG